MMWSLYHIRWIENYLYKNSYMFDKLRLYLINVRIKLKKENQENIPVDQLMEEIAKIAIDNWVDEMEPELSNEQLLIASRRAIAKRYGGN